MKKSLPYLVVILFLGWAIFKFFSSKTTDSSKPMAAPMALDWEQLDSTSNMAKEDIPKTMKSEVKNAEGSGSKGINKTSEQIESSGRFDQFDRIEEFWLMEVAKIINDKKDYKLYLEMREQNEKEKLEAYKEYHEGLKEKYGDKFSYSISEDKSPKERKINQAYLKKLLALIGEAKFKKYIKARDRVNEDNRKNDQNYLLIEF